MTKPEKADTALRLTELQEAAVERIRFFQKELAKYGVYARTGIELEFAILNADGQNIPCRFPISNPADYLKEKQVPYVVKYKREGASFTHGKELRSHAEIEADARGRIANQNPESTYYTQHELLIGEEGEKTLSPAKHYSPVSIAQTTQYLRQRGLHEMLCDTTMLTRLEPHPNAPPLTLPLHPDFSSYRSYDWAEAVFPVEDCMGLHINISANDRKGANLFALCPELAEHCMRSLLKIQRAGMLAMLPCESSLERIEQGGLSVPSGIGRSDEMLPRNKEFRSASLRNDVIDRQKEMRIENRLPGADADPYVATAVTMAALYDTVKRHVHVKKLFEKPDAQHTLLATAGQTLVVEKPAKAAEIHEPIPRQFQEIVQRFEDSAEMRELLGNRLSRAISREYGQSRALG